VLDKAVVHANAQLAAGGFEPLPDHLTPHSLRRTFASLLFAIGEAPPYVMAQTGHTTPNLTLAIYARQMDRRDGEPERLRALVEGSGSACTIQPNANAIRQTERSTTPFAPSRHVSYYFGPVNVRRGW
jgi:hypothetical protein